MALSTGRIRRLGTFTIPNGQQASNVITADVYRGMRALMIAAPQALPEAVRLQTADGDGAAPNFNDVHSPPGTTVVIAAAASPVLTAFPFPAMRLFAGAAVGANRSFELWGQF